MLELLSRDACYVSVDNLANVLQWYNDYVTSKMNL